MSQIRHPLRFLLPLMLLLILGASGIGPLAAQSVDELPPVTDVFKLKTDTGNPGLLKLHWSVMHGYYLYRGRIKLKPAEGVTLGELQLPPGEKHHDEYLGDVETYRQDFDGSVTYALPPGTTHLKLSVQYQGCHDEEPKICYPPHTEDLDLVVPATVAGATPAQPTGADKLFDTAGSHSTSASTNGPALPAEQAFRFEAVATSSNQLLLRWTMPKGYYLYRDQTKLSLTQAQGLHLGQPLWPAGTPHEDSHYGATTVYFDQLELPVALIGDVGGRAQLQLQASFQGCQDGGICYPVMTRAVTVDLSGNGGHTDETAAATEPHTGLLAALALALLGGLVLNLMPCVLPVLSIKAVGLLESGENHSTARRHALFYSAGVLASFALLGLGIVLLRSAGHALGWGTQLQQPWVVGVLACVMLAVGLSMSGVVQFGAGLANTGQSLASRSGAAGDFFTGVLAVVVASPCTAPFMGSALAYAFAAPLAAALLVFLALGLGLALPFLLIGFVPSLARLLPRPGRWMETLKQVLAFPMYLTAAWLIWVLANQRGADAVGLVLVACVLLAMTLWWFEQSRTRGAISKAAALVLLVATVVPLYLLAQVQRPATAAIASNDAVVAYSPAKLAELRQAGTPVFVDMTADWCVTCKANEHTVLNTDAFRALLKRTGTVYMKGDWTDTNATIAAFLQQYHSPGVPLYVVFPKSGGAGKALSTVLTPSMVEQALTEAAR